MSIATILRFLTVKPPTENGSPSRVETSPAADVGDDHRPHSATRTKLKFAFVWTGSG
jgi:hypothetical protein